MRGGQLIQVVPGRQRSWARQIGQNRSQGHHLPPGGSPYQGPQAPAVRHPSLAGECPTSSSGGFISPASRYTQAAEPPGYMIRALITIPGGAFQRARPDSTPSPSCRLGATGRLVGRSGGDTYPARRRGVWSRTMWSLVARIAVIPWSLVAHTNNRPKSSSNSLRD